MSSLRRKLERRAQERHALSRKGLCTRCEKPASEHPDGNCPDGQGGFTWQLDPSEIARLDQTLERALSVMDTPLTRDEERVLEEIRARVLGRGGSDEQRAFTMVATVTAMAQGRPPERVRAPDIARALGLPLHYCRQLMDSLVDKGFLQPPSPRPS